MKFNKDALREYIDLKMQYELLKRSDLFKKDLKQYIEKSIDYQTKINLIKI